MTVPATFTVIVFVPATVDWSVPVVCPLTPVEEPGCVRMFPEPLADNVTVCPDNGLPFPSSAVTVIVEVEVPFATSPVFGLATAVDLTALTPCAVKVTVGCALIWVEPIVTVMVFVSATVDVSVAVVLPFAPVDAGVETVLPEPLTLNDTV